jgi:hypothetical protein
LSCVLPVRPDRRFLFVPCFTIFLYQPLYNYFPSSLLLLS